MRDFSDPGYDWLGELLGSRGYILASVDMNFINGSIRGENDGRGWLLPKHLQAWQRFNEDPDGPFHVRGAGCPGPCASRASWTRPSARWPISRRTST